MKYNNINITRDKEKNTHYRNIQAMKPNLEHRISKCSHDTYQTWVPETSVSDSAGLPQKTPQEQILSTGNTLNSRKALITDGQITNKRATYGLGNT